MIIQSSIFTVDLDAGLVGLALTYSISLTGIFQYCVRESAEVESLVILSFLI